MIPLRGRVPSSGFPVVTVCLITTNMLVFCYQLSLAQGLHAFLMRYGLIPLRFILAGQLAGVSVIVRCYPLFTSMFLHGGWIHVLGNLLYLWIFGHSVEDRLGHARFALFYLVCGHRRLYHG